MPFSNIIVDLEAVRLQQERIYSHIGKYTAASAELDQTLTIFFGALVTPDQKFRSAKAISNEQVGSKLRIIERVLPSASEWPDRKVLLATMQAVISYRNRLAHSQPSALIGATNGAVEWGTRREKDGLSFEILDLAQLEDEERSIRIMLVLLHELIALKPCLTDMSMSDLADLRIRDLLLRSNLAGSMGEDPALRNRLDSLFP